VPDTFISYRREDSAGYAGRLRDSLERRLGSGRIFRDVDTLQPGQDFVRAIDERVRQCRVFLTLIGREWLDARDPAGHRRIDQEEDHVRLEIATALGRDDLLVVPVLVEGAPMPASRDLPASIRSLAFRHAISLRDETWDADVDRLAAVAGAEGGAGPSPARPMPGARPAPRARPGFASSAVLGTAAIVVALLLVFGRPGVDPASAPDTRDLPPDAHGVPASPAAGVSTPERAAPLTPSSPDTPASPDAGAATPRPPAATSGRRDAAELDRLDAEIDQLHTRFVAVDQSLASLREQQARTGLALRSDMAARHEAARVNLGRAREAISTGDLARARRFTDLAAADLQALERFLSR
jgi:hypothetical protein